LKTQVIAFPTFVQTVKGTADVNEEHPLNEELVFNSKEGQEVRADVSLSYAIEAARVPEFYDLFDKVTVVISHSTRNHLHSVGAITAVARLRARLSQTRILPLCIS
jgi:hypothetical protein